MLQAIVAGATKDKTPGRHGSKMARGAPALPWLLQTLDVRCRTGASVAQRGGGRHYGGGGSCWGGGGGGCCRGSCAGGAWL
jgi:hypothetical protein